MDVTLSEFRAEVLRLRSECKQGAPPYSPEMRAFAIQHVRSAMGGGGSVASASRDLGIHGITISSWLRRQSTGGRLRKVAIVDQRPAGNEAPLTVTTASGYTIAGLTLQQAVKLLVGLG